MKPSEMSNEELADHMWDAWRGFINDRCINSKEVDEEEALQEEAYARLRNSIPKPKNIHVVVYDGVNLVIDGTYVCDLSDRYSKHAHMRRDAEQRLRTALGINDTEGGV